MSARNRWCLCLPCLHAVSGRYDEADCSVKIELKPEKPLPAITSFFKKKVPPGDDGRETGSASKTGALTKAVIGEEKPSKLLVNTKSEPSEDANEPSKKTDGREMSALPKAEVVHNTVKHSPTTRGDRSTPLDLSQGEGEVVDAARDLEMSSTTRCKRPRAAPGKTSGSSSGSASPRSPGRKRPAAGGGKGSLAMLQKNQPRLTSFFPPA